MVLLAIVNADYNFGTNGRISDGRVLQDTTFFQKLENNDLNIPNEGNITDSNISVPYVSVADSAFPFRIEMLEPKPFRQPDCTSDERRIYNYQVSRARRLKMLFSEYFTPK